jgi:hypothetical protein
MRSLPCTLVVITWLVFAGNAKAQDPDVTDAPRWTTQFSLAGANALLSGLTAGITQELRGGSFRDGFTRGTLGGLVIYGGKRIAVEKVSGAGLLGRQVAAVGTSMVRNASDGVGLLDRLVFPVGFARMYWQRAQPTHWQTKLDVIGLAWTVYGVAESELEFNLEKTLSAGVPVFETTGSIISVYDEQAGGLATGGAIFLSRTPQSSGRFLHDAFAHERVHVLQSDQIFLTVLDPHDDRALRWLPYGQQLNRWLDINLSSEMFGIGSLLIDRHGDRPWEIEANYLIR